MSGLSRYAAQGLFDRTLNPSTREAPNFLALHKAAVDDEAYGGEADYIGYVRMPLNSMYAQVTPTVGGEVVLIARNGSQVIFPSSEGPINLLTHWAIWDTETIGDGNVLYSDALAFSKILEFGDVLIVQPDELALSFL